ncbi:GTP 3',8-cyclase MoaA [Oxyplasma meridianum]|uniref:Probable GTP 3',8-cyclase n=1 Tax=Oxyplasma meridianum TaxID=3073602 RepID=A0AAX4NFM4_9ARCH
MITDDYGRPVTSMRIQVNTTCNFKCFFCHMEGTGVHSEKMTPDEIERIVEIGHKMGVNKIKFTGGEPLLRNDIVEIVRRTRKHIDGDISMTTNGFMLPVYAEALKAAGLDRVNISFHSLERESFQFITGTDSMDKVIEGIKAAKKAHFDPIKLNFVVLKGVNEDQVQRLVNISAILGVRVQFIEYETTREGINSEDFQRYHIDLNPFENEISKSAVEIKHNILHNRPRYIVQTENGYADVEFVKPMMNSDFCNHCTRIRVTSTGLLKPCLMRSDNYIDILKEIKNENSEEKLTDIYLKAVRSREPYWKENYENSGKVLRTVQGYNGN